ncbi:beta-glucosidase [Microvirga rosea]|uniref:beta-glucosidase n=1 Tax=Microvirga rosea TaxID=2715425 RepID=UPI001D09F46C|nr:beta-glucosidase [Microvirga rosea]MCB8820519.1 beta-glucosidase [Microvirga rosea]
MITPVPISSFRSFILGGFECSTHRRCDGQRLDLVASTGHAALASTDYRALSRHGIDATRDGLRWHLIEKAPGAYDWSSLLPMLTAARDSGTQVIWDLCHYGWPDDIDIWSPEFVTRFAGFAAAAAQVVRSETTGDTVYCPINEISYWAWAGGETGRFNPCCHGRGADLKRQLIRATLAAIDAIRHVDPQARFITAEPIINVEAGLGDEDHSRGAELYRQAQFEVFDMLCGRMEPELGGRPDYIDVIGVNYYPDNQWYHGGPTIPMGHHAYRPLNEMLAEVFRRYERPLMLSETGSEGSGRAAWLHYVCAEVRLAMEIGVPIEGICLYPILDYAGWDNGRTCHVGLLSHADDHGQRHPYAPLARELSRQDDLFRELEITAGRHANVLAVAE